MHLCPNLLRLFKNYKKQTALFIGGEDGTNLQSFRHPTNFYFTTLKTTLMSSVPCYPVSVMGVAFGLYGVGNRIGGLTLTFANGALIQPYTSLKRPTDGQKLMLRIKNNGTVVSQAVTWTTTSGAYRVIGTTLPTTTSSNATTGVAYVGCIYNSSDTFWDVLAVGTI